MIVACAVLASASALLMFGPESPSSSHAAENKGAEPTDKSRDADIAMLKNRAPDQAHAMVSVAYHFNNLWFAVKAENWPLAEFYWNETRSHLRWSVRIIPVRKDLAGREIKLEDILKAIENAPLAKLKDAITEKNTDKFVAAYKFTVEGCYSCHKAADKPYLRPRMPEQQPAEPMINFDPKATWPL